MQKGFTLIELIIVIVILGILSIVAAPRFLGFSSDANRAALNSMAGSVKSASSLVFAKSQINGTAGSASNNLDLDNDGNADIETVYGYPSSSRGLGLKEVLDSSFEEDWTWATNFAESVYYIASAKVAGRSGFYVNQTVAVGTDCYMTYQQASNSDSQPVITLFTDGC